MIRRSFFVNKFAWCKAWQWVSGHETYRTEPTGGELKHCRRIWDKYHEEILDLQHDYAYEAEIEAYV